MGTALGAGTGNHVVHGLNVSTATIARGTAVKLGTAAQFAANKLNSLSIAEDAIPVQVVSGTSDIVIGFATKDVAAGAVGEFVRWGLLKLLSGAAVAADARIQILNNGKVDDASGINSGAHYGVCMVAATGADELISCFVDVPSIEGET